MNSPQKLRKNNDGMVAIMVAIFLVLIVSLVVVSYSQLVRREQRQTLDRQLNTQAFYMAESGIQHISKQLEDPNLPNVYSKTACDDDINDGANPYQVTNLEIEQGNLEVTCSLVETTLEELRYDGVHSDSLVVPVDAGGGAIGSLDIKWHSSSGGIDVSGCPSVSTLPQSLPANCTLGVVKVDLVNTTSLADANDLDNIFTVYLYPGDGGSSSMSYSDALGASKQGKIVPVSCDASGCSMTINDLSADLYHARLQSFYNPSNIRLSMDGGSFHNAQTSIDVTAKAVDVLRRVKVYVSTSGYSNKGALDPAPGALRTADSICKQYSVLPGDSVTSACLAP